MSESGGRVRQTEVDPVIQFLVFASLAAQRGFAVFCQEMEGVALDDLVSSCGW